MSSSNPNNLGPRVSVRDTNWADLVHRAWGSEFYAPDHGIYEFSNGKKYDSTDKGLTGLYGVIVTAPLEITLSYQSNIFDMDNSILVDDTNHPLHIDGDGLDTYLRLWFNSAGTSEDWINSSNTVISWVGS